MDIHKGLLCVSSGIDFDKYDPAREEILSQLEAMRRGEITPDELAAAKRSVANGLRTVEDSPMGLESFYLSQTIQGLDASPMDLAALTEEITAEQIVEIAGGVELDAVYFLKGEETE